MVRWVFLIKAVHIKKLTVGYLKMFNIIYQFQPIICFIYHSVGPCMVVAIFLVGHMMSGF